MSASKPVPANEGEDVEEAVPENKLTLDNMAKGFQLIKTAFDFLHGPFCDMGTETKASDRKRTGTFRESKHKNSGRNCYIFS